MANKKITTKGFDELIADLNNSSNTAKVIQGKEVRLFDNFINKNKKIDASENILRNVFLKSLCLITEFRKLIFKELDINFRQKDNNHVFSEVSFLSVPEGSNKKGGKFKLDGLLIIERNNEIIDAIGFEFKSGKNKIEPEQIDNYLKLAKAVGISKFITISNEYSSNPKLLPYSVKTSKAVNVCHLSWNYILGMANILVNDNDTNIEDIDQKNLMQEVIYLFNSPAFEIDNFKVLKGLKDIRSKIIEEKITAKSKIEDYLELLDSWIQEEKDLAVQLSVMLGVRVSIKIPKEVNSMDSRREQLKKQLIDSKELKSEYIIPNAIDTIKTSYNILNNYISMYVTLKDKSSSLVNDRIIYLRESLKDCRKYSKDFSSFDDFIQYLFIEIKIKKAKESKKIYLKDIIDYESFIDSNKINGKWFMNIYKQDQYKDKEINEIKIGLTKPIENFKKSTIEKIFITQYEHLVFNFYSFIVEHLKKNTPKAPSKNEQTIIAD